MNLVEIFERFPTQDDCIAHLEAVRWKGRPTCPYCKSANVTPMPKERRHHCNNCNTTFSVTVGTIFHHTHLQLQKWFLAVTLILNAKKGISSRQLSRDLKVNKNTSWRIAMQIRKAMLQADERALLTGVVEMDECFIGGKPRKGNGEKPKRGRGTKKTPVIGMIERGGRVKAQVAKKKDLKAKSISALVRRSLDTLNTTLITDEYGGYFYIGTFMEHRVIRLQRGWYVDGDKHTNNIESFWALLKRGIVGQFHKVSVRHLPRYLDEFTYRHNHRDDPNLFARTIERGLGVVQ